MTEAELIAVAEARGWTDVRVVVDMNPGFEFRPQVGLEAKDRGEWRRFGVVLPKSAGTDAGVGFVQIAQWIGEQ